MKQLKRILSDSRGFTMAELMVTTVILSLVLVVINGVFFSTNEMYVKTNRRAAIQMDARLGSSILLKELRHAGCDPTGTALNSGLGLADATAIRVLADMDADGNITTVEPSEDVTYTYNAGQQTVFRNPGAGPQPIATNVTAFNITYFDNNNNALGPLPLTAQQMSQVQSIGLTMTTADRDVGDVTVSTTIAMRN